jgi:hypothetical protein
MFGASSVFEPVFTILVMALPFVLAVWFIRTLSTIATSLGQIVERLAALERAVRDEGAGRRL